MSELPHAVAGIVFDCDGLLLDTETAWARAEGALLARYDRPYGEVERALLLGRTVDDICDVIAALIGQPSRGPNLHDDLMALVEAELGDHVTPMTGARELIGTLAGRAPLAIASNSNRLILDAVLQSSGFADDFTVIVAADEVTRPKPHPELYLTAFARLGVSPSAGVAFEDSSTGVAAARAAGTFVVTVPSHAGTPLDGDFVTTSLSDPRLHQWAHTIGVPLA